MNTCRYTKIMEAAFDGERPRSDALDAHLEACPLCRAHLANLERMRAAVGAVAERTRIEDPQMPAFMAGIREGMEAPARRPRSWIAATSLVTAALVMALATFVMLKGGPDPVRATEVEYLSTDLENATVEWYDSEDLGTTIWINQAGDDL